MMKIIEITPGVRNVINDLKEGAKLLVTHEKEGFAVSIEGGGQNT
jgi:hypothetical protein